MVGPLLLGMKENYDLGESMIERFWSLHSWLAKI